MNQRMFGHSVRSLPLKPPMKLLIERIEGRRTDRHIILPPRLDVKGSTGPAPVRA